MSENLLQTTETIIPASSQSPTVIASFCGYAPPFDPVPIVQRMLASVSPKYLVGLQRVVLTNSTGLPRKLRRAVTKSRGRKVRMVEARGVYHPAWRGNLAWIEIFVDNTLERCEKRRWSRLGFLREAEIGGVLFHEIGHHIHFTARPEYREKEDVADVWKARLGMNYRRGRYPILRKILRLLSPLTGPLIRGFHETAARRMLAVGAISRVEFDEEFKEK
jgi:hypothetical protein